MIIFQEITWAITLKINCNRDGFIIVAQANLQFVYGNKQFTSFAIYKILRWTSIASFRNKTRSWNWCWFQNRKKCKLLVKQNKIAFKLFQIPDSPTNFTYVYRIWQFERFIANESMRVPLARIFPTVKCVYFAKSIFFIFKIWNANFRHRLVFRKKINKNYSKFLI